MSESLSRRHLPLLLKQKLLDQLSGSLIQSEPAHQHRRRRNRRRRRRRRQGEKKPEQQGFASFPARPSRAPIAAPNPKAA
jgi:hypothetical protein